MTEQPPTDPTDPGEPDVPDPELVVPARFNGPPTSGNGGWVCGAVTALARPVGDHGAPWPAVEVTLAAPPPLDVAMRARHEPGERLTVTHGPTTVAVARPGPTEPVPVEPVDVERVRSLDLAANLASTADEHPFPTCFVCGPDRADGDGLRIFAGPVGPDRVAATWTPTASVTEDWHDFREPTEHVSLPVTWAALDCPGAWALGIGAGCPTMVLGRMTARVDRLPVVGEEHVVVAEARRRDGRKLFAATSLYDGSGSLVASAEQTWITVAS